MILSREQVENIKTCLSCGSLDCHTTLGCKIQLEIKCTKSTENLIDTIRYLQQESDRRELEHEKARRAVEVELLDEKNINESLLQYKKLTEQGLRPGVIWNGDTVIRMIDKLKAVEEERDRLKKEIDYRNKHSSTDIIWRTCNT